MYKKDDFLLTLPLPMYIGRGKLLENVGSQCSLFDYDFYPKEYWTGIAKVTQGDPDGVIFDEMGKTHEAYLDDTHGVRPILKSPYLPEIITKAKCYRDEHNILIVELGKWPKSQASYRVLIDKISELKFTGKAYPFVSEEYAYEVVNDYGKWALYDQKLYGLKNIQWYYDEEYKLLLSKHILFLDEIGYIDFRREYKPDLAASQKISGNYFELTDLYEKLNSEVLNLILSTANLLPENTENNLNSDDISKIKSLLEEQVRLNKILKRNKKELYEQTAKRKSHKFI